MPSTTSSSLPPLNLPPPPPQTEPYDLTPDQKSFFLENGYIRIQNCFSREQAAAFTSTMWARLGMDENDKGSWGRVRNGDGEKKEGEEEQEEVKERINMPFHNLIRVQEFAPKAWAAMVELCGGEDRIGEGLGFKGAWGDGFIVNFGLEEYDEDDDPGYRELDNWHNDGDFFVHFLDSPEQALLVIPLWSDIKPKGGGTIICPDGIKHIAQHMHDHPEGTTPWMTSINTSSEEELAYEGRSFWHSLVRDPSKTRDESFIEATGEVGDVYLLHPFMLHSASKNLRRDIRVITNPPVSLGEPFRLHRGDGEGKYSLVERKTLRDLGIEVGETGVGLKDWKIQGERKPWIPSRLKVFDAMRVKEMENLKKLGKENISEPNGDATAVVGS